MRLAFQEQLHEIEHGLAELSKLVEKAITRATKAFQTSDVTLAQTVIDADAEIDHKSVALDELVIDVLVRQQPVASDLRLAVSALRMASSLERMGDLAEHIALFARYRYPDAVIPEPLYSIFQRMGEIDIKLAGLVVQLLETRESKYIQQIQDTDDELDALHVKVFEHLLADTFDGARVNVVDATLASRYHERFGDHAVSISKRVRYLISGE